MLAENGSKVVYFTWHIRDRRKELKRRIEQLLNGIFEYAPSKLLIEPEKLEIQAQPGAVVCGSFRISAADHCKVKGFLYTSGPRMICEPAEFQGTENDIRYQIDCSGFGDGVTEQGVSSSSPKWRQTAAKICG